MWNSLPDNAILADNVNHFKNRLDKHWKMHDIVFNYRADFAETGLSLPRELARPGVSCRPTLIILYL